MNKCQRERKSTSVTGWENKDAGGYSWGVSYNTEGKCKGRSLEKVIAKGQIYFTEVKERAKQGETNPKYKFLNVS